MLQIDQYAATILSLSLAVVFLSPKGRDPRAIDLILAVLAVVLGGIIAIGYTDFSTRIFFGDADLLILSVAFISVCLVAAPRVAGWPMTLLVLAFIVFGAVAKHFPAPITAPPFSLQTYALYLSFGGDALIGQVIRIVSVVVLAYVLFGRLFELIGGTDYFAMLARQISGAGPGGPVKVAVVTSGLFGSISGSTTANVVTSGGFSIPMMKRIGLAAHQAAATEAVASTGGQIMPPVMGIAAFLMIEIAGIAYADLITAAFIPAVLFFVSVFVQADGMARRLGLSSTPPGPPDWSAIVVGGLKVSVPIAMIVVSLLTWPHAPQRGAVLASAACMAMAFMWNRSPRAYLRQIADKMASAGETASRIMVTGALVGILLGVINSTGLGVAGALAIENLAGSGLLPALVAALVASLFLGLGLATTAVYAVVGTLVAPSLIAFGVPVIAAHLFVFYSAMLSMITPPIALACLAASGLADASFWRTCGTALRMGWSLFLLPFLFVMHPEILLDGSALEVALRLPATVVGVVLLSFAAALPLNRMRSVAIGALVALMGVLLIWPAIDDRLAAAVSLAIAALWGSEKVGLLPGRGLTRILHGTPAGVGATSQGPAAEATPDRSGRT